MAVAYIAYQNLTPATRIRIRELLKLNPEYANWEKQIPSGTPADDHDRMIFMIASTWADDIKTEAQYSDDGTDGGDTPGGASSSQNIGYSDLLRHRYWHFVNTPFSPDQTPLPEIPTPNAQTQIVAFRAVLASSQPDELKSYDLVWLVHLIGDVHQPLHAVTRFTKSYPKGDAGGNLVKLDCSKCELHAFWDDLLGTANGLNSTVKAAKKLPTADVTLAAKADEKDWIAESFQAAQQTVYTTPIAAGDGPFTLTPQYKTNAAALAKKRVALAGARLANLLNNELK